MLPLAYPYIILLLLVAGGFLCLLRKWRAALVAIAAALLLNICAQVVPVHFGGSRGAEAGAGAAFPKSTAGEVADRPRRLRVMTFNILSGSGYFKEHREHPEEFVDFVTAQGADVVTFQEFYGNRINRGLYDLMLEHYPYYVCQGYESQVCVFSRYPLAEYRDMVVDTSTASGREFRQRHPKEYDRHRFVVSVTVRMPSDSVRLIACHLYSNHSSRPDSADVPGPGGDAWKGSEFGRLTGRALEYVRAIREGVFVRGIEARWVAGETQVWQARGVKVIVCGDFNDVAGSRALRIMRHEGALHNCWWEKGCGPGFTFIGYDPSADGRPDGEAASAAEMSPGRRDASLVRSLMRLRLDHVLHSRDIHPEGIRVATQGFSDHHPLVADFSY